MRCIDGDSLFKDICDSINKMTKIGICVDGEWLWAKLNDALENAPTIEPERKMGKWIDDCECSVCHWINEDDGGDTLLTYYNYCPNCGAKMDGGEQE